tara:strand:+ start:20106 stop:20408 length:303 start_codon:yes stop_codon:yes gene_type:complete
MAKLLANINVCEDIDNRGFIVFKVQNPLNKVSISCKSLRDVKDFCEKNKLIFDPDFLEKLSVLEFENYKWRIPRLYIEGKCQNRTKEFIENLQKTIGWNL